MLPGELQEKYANDPLYQRYQSWHQTTGGRWAWWTAAAQKAAKDAGISQLNPDAQRRKEAGRTITTDWGEQIDYDAQGNMITDMTNPAWTAFIQNFMAQHGNGPTPEGYGSEAWDAAHPGGANISWEGTELGMRPEDYYGPGGPGYQPSSSQLQDQAAEYAPVTAPYSGVAAPGRPGGVQAAPDVSPMTTSRQAQMESASQQMLSKVLSSAFGKKGGLKKNPFKNPALLGRAFGAGVVNPFRR